MINTSYIYTNTKRLNNDKKMLDVGMDIVSFLDEIGAFGYKNWINGEVIEGPSVKKYYTNIKFMFPNKLPPDPEVLRRLKKLKCIISLDKDEYKKVVLNKDDWDNMRYNTSIHTVWVINLEIPNRYLPLDGNTTFSIDGEDVNYEDIEAFYDEIETEGEAGGDDFTDDTDLEGGEL